jgi:hypothetical protein
MDALLAMDKQDERSRSAGRRNLRVQVNRIIASQREYVLGVATILQGPFIVTLLLLSLCVQFYAGP